jgi:hypothetical protein
VIHSADDWLRALSDGRREQQRTLVFQQMTENL